MGFFGGTRIYRQNVISGYKNMGSRVPFPILKTVPPSGRN